MTQILRGFATVNYWADDLAAARTWYSELLGIEPYFERDGGYVEFRIGDSEDELGIVDRRWAPPGTPTAPGGVIIYWHVDDVRGTVEKLLAMGATEHLPVTERGPGFVTASVVDPFGNILGVMYNRHYVEQLAR
jgi:predicted enzyme related to lactoylglutathione lyase